MEDVSLFLIPSISASEFVTEADKEIFSVTTRWRRYFKLPLLLDESEDFTAGISYSLSFSFLIEVSGFAEGMPSNAEVIDCFGGWEDCAGGFVTGWEAAETGADTKASNGAGSPGGRGRCFLLWYK